MSAGSARAQQKAQQTLAARAGRPIRAGIRYPGEHMDDGWTHVLAVCAMTRDERLRAMQGGQDADTAEDTKVRRKAQMVQSAGAGDRVRAGVERGPSNRRYGVGERQAALGSTAGSDGVLRGGQAAEKGETMTGDDIKKGRYYRAVNTVWYVLHIWEPSDSSPTRSCEAIRVKDPTNPATSQVMDCSALAAVVRCEVVPTFADVEKPQPDSFIAGLLG